VSRREAGSSGDRRGGDRENGCVEAFAAQVRLDPSVWLAYDQCVEHYGAGEAYLPVLLRREPQTAGEQAKALIVLCTAHGFALYLAAGIIFQGRALAAHGQPEAAVAQIQQGMAAVQAYRGGCYLAALLVDPAS
jgi:hypothetical protein